MELLQSRFCEKTQQALFAQCLSQSDLARAMGVTRAAVSQYVTGRVSPGLGVVEKFAAALKVSPSNLLDDAPLKFQGAPPTAEQARESLHNLLDVVNEMLLAAENASPGALEKMGSLVESLWNHHEPVWQFIESKASKS